MAAFTVAAGTDWLGTLVLGEVGERWRLDDYDIAAHLKSPGNDAVLVDMTLDNGRLVIADPVARRLEINVGWAEIEPLLPGPFIFDLLLENRTTDVRSRSGGHTLSVTAGITLEL